MAEKDMRIMSYTTLVRMEDAFRDLKTDLGLRLVHHQLEERTEAHLFISVLAYHLLISIDSELRRQGDHRRWERYGMSCPLINVQLS
jgi:transposase